MGYTEFISVVILPGASLMFSAWLKHRDSLQSKRNDAIQEGVFALLKDRLVTEYRRITDRLDPEGKSYIYLYELENIQKLNEEYHNLGGNGTVAKLVKELTALPVKKIS